MGRWSAALAPPLVEVARAAGAEGGTWLDVGCGTGSVTAAALTAGAERVVAVDPSPTFTETARGRFVEAPVEVVEASATSLPDHAHGATAAVSSLVLNFTPDPVAALRSIAAALRPDGVGVVAVWNYADERSFLHRFWGAAAQVTPVAAAAVDERTAFDVCTPVSLSRAAAAAGWCPDVWAVDVATTFVDAADLWEPFLAGIGPAGALLASLPAAERDRLRDRYLDDLADDGWPLRCPFQALMVSTAPGPFQGWDMASLSVSSTTGTDT